MPASVFRLLLAPLLLVAALVPASAGTLAELAILGFSKDGKVFAFEEYGIQDGSGFPFANRFYLDVDNDRFLTGTPVRVRIDDEAASLNEARRQAREKGETIIPEAELAANRGNLAGFNAITELSADPLHLRVNPRPVMPAIDPPLVFRLSVTSMPGSATCQAMGPSAGFRLVRIDDGKETVLHADERIPQSRGCPQDYRLGAVQTFYPEAGAPAFAVLIAVQGVGFEGPDFRWIAVTGRP